jgi:hypothetical protein
MIEKKKTVKHLKSWMTNCSSTITEFDRGWWLPWCGCFVCVGQWSTRTSGGKLQGIWMFSREKHEHLNSTWKTKRNHQPHRRRKQQREWRRKQHGGGGPSWSSALGTSPASAVRERRPSLPRARKEEARYWFGLVGTLGGLMGLIGRGGQGDQPIARLLSDAYSVLHSLLISKNCLVLKNELQKLFTWIKINFHVVSHKKCSCIGNRGIQNTI